MVVVDTSALIGAWHAHYLPSFVPVFWEQMEEAMRDGRVTVSTEAYAEIEEESDQLYPWLRERQEWLVAPTPEVQARAGEIEATYRFKPGRDGADPFLIAQAEIGGYALATYEGRSPTGSRAKAKKKYDDIPTICQGLGVSCVQPAEAWRDVGIVLG